MQKAAERAQKRSIATSDSSLESKKSPKSNPRMKVYNFDSTQLPNCQKEFVVKTQPRERKVKALKDKDQKTARSNRSKSNNREVVDIYNEN
jgi:hypothetical protein